MASLRCFEVATGHRLSQLEPSRRAECVTLAALCLVLVFSFRINRSTRQPHCCSRGCLSFFARYGPYFNSPFQGCEGRAGINSVRLPWRTTNASHEIAILVSRQHASTSGKEACALPAELEGLPESSSRAPRVPRSPNHRSSLSILISAGLSRFRLWAWGSPARTTRTRPSTQPG